MIFLGIDPGSSGSIAALDGAGKVIGFVKGDATQHDIRDWLRATALIPGDCHVTVERVQAMAKGGVKQGTSSAFKFGMNFGFYQGVLCGLGLPFDFVQPVKWQTEMSCRTGGDKNVSKAAAQRLWPEQKITHAIADALLIAEYGRRTHKC